ncbi:VanW family protein [Peptacetobacter sp.]|uniref:VanW family protein n=1 Tax=Peptacetobacter sp. TaxID=2991975 RepID=UPI002638D6E3|nr:VanW family protein [Peptacetobacter sp.]
MSKKIKVIIVAILVVILCAFGIVFSKVKSNKIADNVIVNGVNVGGMTKEEAKKEIKIFKANTFIVKNNDRSWKLNLDDMKFRYNIDKTVENAYEVNRDKGIFTNMIGMTKSILGHKNKVYIVTEFNRNRISKELEKIKKDVDRKKENAKINMENKKVSIIAEKDGILLIEDKTERKIEKRLSENKFDTEAVVKVDKPKIKKEDLKGINSLLGTSVTSIKGDYNRTENVRVATESSSGVLLRPGEEYSFNKIVGKRNKKNGYKSAPVIVSGEMQEDLGGGVCQVSSTLYNATLKSGMKIVKVQNHSIPSSYVGMGRDATVTDSGIDFIFKNGYKHNVYVQNYVSGGTIVCQVFGNKSDEQNIEIQTKVISIASATSEKVNKSDLPAGKEVVEKPSRNGYTVETYRIYKDKNGKQIKKEKISTSYYPKKNGVIFVGTAPKEEKPENPENKPENGNSDNTGGETPSPDGGSGSTGGETPNPEV